MGDALGNGEPGVVPGQHHRAPAGGPGGHRFGGSGPHSRHAGEDRRVEGHRTSSRIPAARRTWAGLTSCFPSRSASVRATRWTAAMPRPLQLRRSATCAERVARRAVERDRPLQSSGRDPGVPPPLPPAVPEPLTGHGLRHTIPDHGRPGPERGAGRGRPQRHPEIEPVEQWRRQPPPVPGPVALGADTVGRTETAGAGIGGGDEQEVGRERERRRLPGDPHDPVLQRLAEGVEHRRRELRQFVHEQNAPMGQRDFSEPGAAAAAADERRRRRRVVRRPERPGHSEAAPDRLTGRRVDPGDLQRFVGIQRRQDRRQASGQQRLARARPPDHQEVMAAGRRHLQRPPPAGQAPDHGEVGRGIVVAPGRFVTRLLGRHRRRPLALTFEGIAGLEQRCGREAPAPSDEAGLDALPAGHEHGPGPGAAQDVDHGQHSGNGPERAVEAQFADDPDAVEDAGRQLLTGHHQAEGEREIEPGPRLAHAARGEVDGDPPERPLRPRTTTPPGPGRVIPGTAASGRPTTV